MKFKEYVEVINQLLRDNPEAAEWEVIDKKAEPISEDDVIDGHEFLPGMNGWHYEAPSVLVPID